MTRRSRRFAALSLAAESRQGQVGRAYAYDVALPEFARTRDTAKCYLPFLAGAEGCVQLPILDCAALGS
jgi:hypothetical protein